MFSMLGPAGVTGLRVLDLYAGTGALGLESLRRGAAQAEFVEKDSRRCEGIRESLRRMRAEDRSKVHAGDAIAVTDRLEGEFDVVFIDPPYAMNPFERLLGRMEGRGLIARDAVAFIEHSSQTRLPDILPGVQIVSRKVYGDTAVSVYRRSDDLAPAIGEEAGA